MNLVSQAFYEILQFFFHITGNLGLAIILLTIVVRAAMVPLSVPGMKKQAQNRIKLKKLKPQLDAIKKKFKDDRAKLSQAQMDLYKENGIQLLSFSMLLPFVQIFFLIVLYHVLLSFLKDPEVIQQSYFLGINLVEKDSTYVLPVLAVVTQVVMSVMLLPGLESHDLVPDKSKSAKDKKKNEQETDAQEMAENMQQQMVFILPVMTGFFAASFPAGVALYWVATTVFSIGQQYFISGLGGLEKYFVKFGIIRK